MSTPKIMKILLVEDDLATRTAMHRLLSLHHHEVHSAFSAQAAIKLLSENDYDLVLLDIILGSKLDMTGWAVAAYMKASDKHKDTAVFIVSGLDPDEVRKGAITHADALSSAALIFSKPVDAAALLAAIQLVKPKG